MIKFIGSILLTLSLFQTAFGGHQAESDEYSFSCTWLESDDHAEGYFKENVGFTLTIIGETKAYITNDTFFNRSYSPCWTGGFESCAFAYSYDQEKLWVVDDETDTLTQVWRTEFTTEYNDGLPEEDGTVDGISTISLSYNKNGTTVFSGDDGDGVTFKETFSCKFFDSKTHLK